MGSMPFFCASGGASRWRCVRRAGFVCCVEVLCAEVFRAGALWVFAVAWWDLWVGMALLYRLVGWCRGLRDLSDTHLRLWE